MATTKDLKAQIRQLKSEMKRLGIRKTSFMNGGLEPTTYSYNAELFKLNCELDKAAKDEQLFAEQVRAMFSELNDLHDGSDITLEPYSDPYMVEAIGTLYDGRQFRETYRKTDGDVFVLKGTGCRYRVVAGQYYNGTRTRRYAAFLVR